MLKLSILLSTRVVVIPVVGVLEWLYVFASIKTQKGPSAPIVKQASFPLELIVEMDGQRTVIKDTLIVKFNGIRWSGQSGKYRDWKSKLESGQDRFYLFNNDNSQLTLMLEEAGYYMGEEKKPIQRYDAQKDAFVIDLEKDKKLNFCKIVKSEDFVGEKYTFYDEDSLFTELGIKFISWTVEGRLDNNFK